jgi:putative DNA primase/helicase
MNEESRKFLKAYFGDDLSGVYVCESPRFQPRLAATAKLNPANGWYWCPARLSGLSATGQRIAANAVSVHALVVDDIGTKVDRDEFELFASAPRTMLETSAGNWQAGYRLEGMTPEAWKALRARVPWATDGTDCIHWWRLPGGVNVKKGGFPVGPVTWGEGSLVWLPAEPRYKVKAPKARRGPQPAENPQAVRDILRRIVLGWDGNENSGLRGEWMAGLHGIKGALLEWPEEAYEIGRDWSGPDEPDFDRVWESITPHSAGWGSLEIMAKGRAGPDMAGEAFDDGDDMGLLAAAAEAEARAGAARSPGPAATEPLSAQQMLFARLIREEEAGRMLFNEDRGKWMEFGGKRWEARGHKMGFEKSVAMAALLPVPGKTSEAKFHSGVETFLRNHPAMLTAETAFDRDGLLAGVPSGTLSLRTGRVRAGAPGDMITKCLAVDPAAREDCPRWLKFIQEVTCSDLGMAWFLQQWAGYCLTGGSAEQKLLFLYGPGGNGKSVFVDILREMLGGYGVQASRDVFVKKTHAGHGTEIAKMSGSRLVTMSEVQASAQWDEALLKDASGGGTMTARFMRQDEFTFPVTFKLLGYGNHKPTFPGGVGPAIQRRFVFCEFMFRPKVADKDLTEKLRHEMPGILRWALNGLLDGARGQGSVGLIVPQTMQDATDAYFAEADPLERWMLERTKRDARAKTSTADLFKDWNEWRIANNEHVFDNITVFGATLKDAKGLVAYRTNSDRGFKGLRLEKRVGASAAFDDEEKP